MKSNFLVNLTSKNMQTPPGGSTPIPPLLGPAGSPPPNVPILRQLLVVVLSLQLGLFLGTAALSVLDDSLWLLCGLHFLTGISTILGFLGMALMVLIYLAMGLTPLVPKKLFLPMFCFFPAAMVAELWLMVRYSGRLVLIDLGLSLCQLAFGLGLLVLAQGGWKIRWPLVPARWLGSRVFSWRNTLGWVLVNCFLALAAGALLGYAAMWAVPHFSGGFIKLQRAGIMMEARKYRNADGKTVQLIPMQHIADLAFYRAVARACPSNSLVLMEGVTDEHHLLTNELSYARAAKTLGLVEQDEFDPVHCRLIYADVDVSEFTTNTINLLNLVTLIHTKGINPDTIAQLLQFSPDGLQPLIPADDRAITNSLDNLHGFLDLVDQDLLVKRNAHLLREFWKQLPEGDYFVIPWGAEHMQGIAREIEKNGFQLVETREFVCVRFFAGKQSGTNGAAPARHPE